MVLNYSVTVRGPKASAMPKYRPILGCYGFMIIYV